MELKGSGPFFKKASVAVLCLTMCLRSLAAGPVATFDIAAGDAANTLQEFYRQSEVQVLYLTQNVSGVRTQAVSGRMSASDALATMLMGTGLRFELENEHSALITVAIANFDNIRPGRPASGSDTALLSKTGGEVTVTGTHIRGVLDLIAPKLEVTRKDTKSVSYATVQDVLKGMPASNRATQNEVFGGIGNYNRGSALNLRGLGAGATLVLVNGRRQANSGTQADFVDVNNIPLSAVEKIEVLPDGNSAIYGSDAIAGVVNITLRDKIDGAESQARYGTAINGAEEKVVAQLFGKQWKNGKYLFDYQYSEGSILSASSRWYAADSDKRPLGGQNFSSFSSNPGNFLDPQTFASSYAIPSGQNGLHLSINDLLQGVTNFNNKFEQYDLLPERKMHKAYITASQQLGERSQLFGELRFSRGNTQYRGTSDASERILLVPQSNAFFKSPYTGVSYALVAYSLADDLGSPLSVVVTDNTTATTGLKVDFLSSWQASLSASFARDRLNYTAYNQINDTALAAALADPDPVTALNPFGDGSNTNSATLEAIRSTEGGSSASQLISYSVVADGSILSLPSGTAKLATGIELRTDKLSKITKRPLLTSSRNFSRRVDAGFAELSTPLIGNPDNPRDAPRLDLSLAGRYEQYSDFGSTLNGKISLRWTVIDWLKLRASWGNSFKEPKLVDLYDSAQDIAGMATLPDPKSPNNQSLVLVRQGSNPKLHEETATTWTAGFDIAPEVIPGFSLSITGYSIKYQDQVMQPGGTTPYGILNQENEWAAAIQRNPSRGEVLAICSLPEFFGSVEQCINSTPGAIVDIRLRNLARTKTTGLDIALKGSTQTPYGQFKFGFDGNYIFRMTRAFTDTAPDLNILDTPHNPLALRIAATAGWNQRRGKAEGYSGLLTLHHAGSYSNPESSLRPYANSSTTLDLLLSYRTGKTEGVWSDTEFSLNTVNIFNRAPPFLDDMWGFDTLNAEPIGRVVSFYLEKNW